MNEILTTILQDNFTLAQAKERLKSVKEELLKKFFGGEPQKELTSMPPAFYQNFTKDNVYDLLNSLETEINKLKILTMYLTFEPDDITLRSIGEFARKMFGPALLLDIKLDPGLIAGTALVWNGVYRDYSVRSNVEAKKSEILISFKKFLR